MKRLLICLAPWMVMTAAAQQQDMPRQVEVLYSNVGPAEAWRVGDECYIAQDVIASWHWQANVNGTEATIQAEGRTLKVPTRVVHERVLFPVRAVFEQLGAKCQWHGDDEMDILGEVRMIAVKDGSLQIDSTISSRPHVFSLTDPPRLVVDLRGMTLGARAASTLPPGVNAAQYAPDTVRVVFQAADIPRKLANSDDATRHFEYNLDFTHAQDKLKARPGVDPQIEVSPPGGATGDEEHVGSNPTSPGVVAAEIQAKAPTVTAESANSLNLSIPLSASLGQANTIRWHRVDLFTFELTLPHVQFADTPDKIDSESIESLQIKQLGADSILRIQTNKPMGLKLSTTESSIEIMLRKPGPEARLQGRTIVIDPGHGGHDTGAQSPDRQVLEKDLTLDIGKFAAEELTAAGATVIMTRDSDVFIPLPDRPKVANTNSADLFISIHINSNKLVESRSGTTTYYHAHDAKSEALAECIEHEIAKVSGLPKLGVLSDYTRYNTGFAVLRGSRMPAVLIETGYINNSFDRARMSDQDFQDAVARAVVKGVRVFLSDAKEEDSN